MENIFIKIISSLNKPIHYFFVGLCLIIWNKVVEKEPTYILLVGIIFVLLFIASIIEFIIRKVAMYNRKSKMLKRKEEHEKNKNEQLKSQIIWIQDEYQRLKGKEKEIIDYCIKNNSRVFQQSELIFENYSEAINSLIAKGFASSKSSSLTFIIDETTFLVLDRFINGQKDKSAKDKRKSKNESN